MQTRETPVDETLPSTVAKALLLAEMNAQGVRPIDLAERLGATRQGVNRLLDLRHPTKIDAIDEALRLLGKRLVLTLADA